MSRVVHAVVDFVVGDAVGSPVASPSKTSSAPNGTAVVVSCAAGRFDFDARRAGARETASALALTPTMRRAPRW